MWVFLMRSWITDLLTASLVVLPLTYKRLIGSTRLLIKLRFLWCECREESSKQDKQYEIYQLFLFCYCCAKNRICKITDKWVLHYLLQPINNPMIDVPLSLFLAKTILVENEESMDMCQVLQSNQCCQ